MDKNLINIDDFVRQRLGNSEERERSGAWMQMRELLDSEMPQNKPFRLFSWRKTLSYIGLLFLAGTLAVGSYKLPSFNSFTAFNNPPTHVPTTMATVANEPKLNEKIVQDAESNNPVTKQYSAPVENGKKPELGQNKKNNHAIVATKNEKSSSVNGSVKTEVPAFAIASELLNRKTKTGKIAKTEENRSSKQRDLDKLSDNKVGYLPNIKKNSRKSDDNDFSNNSTDSKENSAKDNTANTNSEKNVETARSGNTKNIANRVGNNNVFGSDISSGVSTKKNKGSKISAKLEKQDIAKEKTAHSLKDENGKRTSTESEVGVQSGANRKQLSGRTDKKLAKNNDSNRKRIDEKPTLSENKKIRDEKSIEITKVTINRRFVHSSADRGYFIFDTISKEQLFEKLRDLTEQAAKAIQSTSENQSAVASAAKEIPNAELSKESSSIKTSNEKKSNYVSNQSLGSKMLSGLSNAFNDIKNNTRGATFSSGLTAGINSTCFGPALFNGLHFGFVENMNFNDVWSLQAELKYFHRINSDYQINDNYYEYEPSTTGGYTKIKMDYTFAFSTLHSFELPLFAQYNAKNFSFFGGGNFVYTLAVNTGAAPIPDNTAPHISVAAIGNDTKPTLSNNDFGQRFGIGYLFGISYRISPALSFDLRSVQTIWDNVKSEGALKVSNMLYKSPSLQLSMGYRFGSMRRGK